ncbi:hypothetical protein RRG08_028029 [Elysia crispata]|uniref:Uncharacterized protein n=1 Tax=Elysia crispata TaxID=231223 RepID=A0AAE1BB62_9GAST|nr:hypothetical protein RRG08_028029 [Elysia crispata]
MWLWCSRRAFKDEPSPSISCLESEYLTEQYRDDWSGCSCDAMCLIYGDWDFHQSCPAQVHLYHQSHLKQAAATCEEWCLLLTYRHGSLSSQGGFGLAEIHGTPSLTIADIFNYLTGDQVALTDTETGQHYRSTRDFRLLNHQADLSQQQRLVTWDILLTHSSESDLKLADMLDYMRDQARLPVDQLNDFVCAACKSDILATPLPAEPHSLRGGRIQNKLCKLQLRL